MVTYLCVRGHDELHHEGESLVLLDGEVKRISVLGTLLRELTHEPRTTEELVAGLVEAFGAPADGSAEEMTRQAVDTMVEAGLLTRLTD
ncbi:hypothetical protein [Ornithinimicrobium panacihumi]|uniref:hypothetical protein n=1 Tax=Ornithinimicrobium panacihumi TaxID=2008449 RepID=UPI003F88DD74